MIIAQDKTLAPFAAFIAFLQVWEKGFQCDPADPGNWTGGAIGQGICKGTNCGISARSYPDADIRNMTWETAAPIYKRDFWDAVKADTLPRATAIVTADAAVNNGPKSALEFLQAALGVGEDGDFGPVTADAIKTFWNEDRDIARESLIERSSADLADAMKAKIAGDSAGAFIDGWENRIISLAFYVA